MSVDSSFGRVLAEYRKRQGLSRSQLAEASGLSYPYVSQLETGLRKPSRKAAAQLAAALGVDPMALEAALPPDDASSPSFQRSLRAQAALLSGDPAEMRSLTDEAVAGERGWSRPVPHDGPPTPADVVGQIVDLVEELAVGERLDALSEAQKQVMHRMLDERTRES